MLFLDLPVLALLLVVLLSVYRARRCLLKIDAASNWACCAGHRRRLLLQQQQQQAPGAAGEQKQGGNERKAGADAIAAASVADGDAAVGRSGFDISFGPEVHAVIAVQAAGLLLDLPFIVMGVVTLCSGWRTYFLWTDLEFGTNERDFFSRQIPAVLG